MSSNAALSAARRRRSNPSTAAPSSTNMQSHVPPANRIIQRTGHPQPQLQPQLQPPQFNQRIPPPPLSQQPSQMQPQFQPHSQMRGPPPHQVNQINGRYQGQAQPQMQGRVQAQPLSQQESFPPLPPPVKTAGPLYGIPVHPLMMFKTHDNKLSEHDLSIGDCFEQLKELDDRLTVIESSSSNDVSNGDDKGVGVGDLNDLMNDEVFINGVVDNIMNTTNFASIVDNVIPLKEENEALKQQVHGLYDQIQGLHKQLEEWKERMQHLESHVHSSNSSHSFSSTSENTVQQVENADSHEATTCNEAGKDNDDNDDDVEKE